MIVIRTVATEMSAPPLRSLKEPAELRNLKAVVAQNLLSFDQLSDLSPLVRMIVNFECPLHHKYTEFDFVTMMKISFLVDHGFNRLINGLNCLAKYGLNLLQSESKRTSNWRSIFLLDDFFLNNIECVTGSHSVLYKLGYVDRRSNCLFFPPPLQPEKPIVIRLTLDLLACKMELEMFVKQQHPNPQTINQHLPRSPTLCYRPPLITTPTIGAPLPAIDTRLQQSETRLQQTGVRQTNCDIPATVAVESVSLPSSDSKTRTVSTAANYRQTSSAVGTSTAAASSVTACSSSGSSSSNGCGVSVVEALVCDICGQSAAVWNCTECDNKMVCTACDNKWHQHPRRRQHIRQQLVSNIQGASRDTSVTNIHQGHSLEGQSSSVGKTKNASIPVENVSKIEQLTTGKKPMSLDSIERERSTRPRTSMSRQSSSLHSGLRTPEKPDIKLDDIQQMVKLLNSKTQELSLSGSLSSYKTQDYSFITDDVSATPGNLLECQSASHHTPLTPGPMTPGPVTPGQVTPGQVTPGPMTPGPMTPGPVTLGPVTPGPMTPGPVTPGPVTVNTLPTVVSSEYQQVSFTDDELNELLAQTKAPPATNFVSSNSLLQQFTGKDFQTSLAQPTATSVGQTSWTLPPPGGKGQQPGAQDSQTVPLPGGKDSRPGVVVSRMSDGEVGVEKRRPVETDWHRSKFVDVQDEVYREKKIAHEQFTQQQQRDAHSSVSPIVPCVPLLLSAISSVSPTAVPISLSNLPFKDRMELLQREMIAAQSTVAAQAVIRAYMFADQQGFINEEFETVLLLCKDKMAEVDVFLITSWTALVAELLKCVRSKLELDTQFNANVMARTVLAQCSGDVSRAGDVFMAQWNNMVDELISRCQLPVDSRQSAVTTLCQCNADVEEAIVQFTKNSFIEHIYADSSNESSGEHNSHLDSNLWSLLQDSNIDYDRRVRMVLSEANLQGWVRGQNAVSLLTCDPALPDGTLLADVIEAVKSFSNVTDCRRFLEKECEVCYCVFPERQILNLPCCQCCVCRDCLRGHFDVIVRERYVRNMTCPVCSQPDIDDSQQTDVYLQVLLIMLQDLLTSEVFELFQTKLRDWNLMMEPMFRWCAYADCRCGFVIDAELSHLSKVVCPNCHRPMCQLCKKVWEDQHEGISCEDFQAWKVANDPELQAMGLARHLEDNGIECPQCKCRYSLAKGGCMHFTCYQCRHEFCSGCLEPFRRGKKCKQLKSCSKAGLHCHHPRNCLFYLRDHDVTQLQKLLQEHNVTYDTTFPTTGQQCPEGAESSQGAESVVVHSCSVMEQKQTQTGFKDEPCGKAVPANFAGLCELHYKEYLVGLVNRNAIDPAEVMSDTELTLLLERAEKQKPRKERKETTPDYTKRLLQIVQRELPLIVRRTMPFATSHQSTPGGATSHQQQPEPLLVGRGAVDQSARDTLIPRGVAVVWPLIVSRGRGVDEMDGIDEIDGDGINSVCCSPLFVCQRVASGQMFVPQHLIN